MPLPTSLTPARLATAALVLAHLGLAAVWWSASPFPRGFRDEYLMVELATEIAFGGDRRSLWRGDYYPPLLRLPGVVALWLGGGYTAMRAVQALIWLPLLAVGTFAAARRVTGEWGAALAVALLLPAAGVLDALHRIEPNLGGMAAGAGALGAWAWSEHLRRRGPTLLLAGALALGLMVDRLGALPFAALPILWSLGRGRRDPLVRRHGLLLVGILLVTVGWWYLLSARLFLGEWLPQLLSGEMTREGLVLEERPPALLWLLHYLVLWPDSQVGLLGGTALLVGVGWSLRGADARRIELLVWLGLGLLLFTLIPKRQPFYTLPLLPAAAALAASTFARRPAIAMALAVLVSVPAVLTSHPGLLERHDGLGSWAWLHRNPLPDWVVGQRFPLGHAPDEPGLDVEALLGQLAAEGVPEHGVVLVLSDDGQISESQLLSALRIARRDVAVLGVVLHPGGVVGVGAQARALIDLRQAPMGFPTRADLIASYEARFGWEGDEALIEAMAAFGRRARRADQQVLPSGATLTLWVAEGG